MSAPLAPALPSRRLLGQALLPGATAPVHAALDVAGAHIVAVHPLAPGEAPPPLPADVPIDDLGAALLTPAFIDAHTHLALTATRGLSLPTEADGNLVEAFFFRIETHTTAEDIRAFTRLGAYEALLHGTALVWDHYYYPDAVLAGLRDVGLPAVLAPTLQDLGGPGLAQREANLARTADFARDPALAALGYFAAYGPHATDTVSDALFTRVAEAAARDALPVHVHVAQSLEEVERVHAAGRGTPIGVLRRTGLLDAAPMTLLIHNIFSTPADLAALPRDRAALGLCPHSKEIFAFVPDLRAWQASGLPWFVGTDCAASNDAWNVQRDLRAVVGHRVAGVPFSSAHATFAAHGTLDAARAVWAERATERAALPGLADPLTLLDRIWRIPGALHPAFRAGVLAPGALANVIAWDLDHPTFWPARDPLRALAMSDTTGAILNVMAAGRWRGAHGDYARSLLATDAYRDAHREASDRLAALVRRI